MMRQTTHDADDDLRNEDIRIFVSDEIVPRDEARGSVYDSGFMLGDGMWEGMRLQRATGDGRDGPVRTRIQRLYRVLVEADVRRVDA